MWVVRYEYSVGRFRNSRRHYRSRTMARIARWTRYRRWSNAVVMAWGKARPARPAPLVRLGQGEYKTDIMPEDI
jgi:hypothetical protein